jgi:hypothetical protein
LERLRETLLRFLDGDRRGADLLQRRALPVEVAFDQGDDGFKLLLATARGGLSPPAPARFAAARRLIAAGGDDRVGAVEFRQCGGRALRLRLDGGKLGLLTGERLLLTLEAFGGAVAESVDRA